MKKLVFVIDNFGMEILCALVFLSVVAFATACIALAIFVMFGFTFALAGILGHYRAACLSSVLMVTATVVINLTKGQLPSNQGEVLKILWWAFISYFLANALMAFGSRRLGLHEV